MTGFNRRQILAASALLCVPHLAFASEPYPSKSIRLTTANSAGSGADGTHMAFPSRSKLKRMA